MAARRWQIRPERPGDTAAIAEVVRRAFADIAYSDHREHELVARLRASPAYLPQLSLVAAIGPQIFGHVMLTRVFVRDGETRVPSLSLAPLSVAPERQRSGIGSALVAAAHSRARDLGFGSIVLVGSPHYYRRFGYAPLRPYGIILPFPVADEVCMILPLAVDALRGVTGTVEYPAAWTAAMKPSDRIGTS